MGEATTWDPAGPAVGALPRAQAPQQDSTCPVVGAPIRDRRWEGVCPPARQSSGLWSRLARISPPGHWPHCSSPCPTPSTSMTWHDNRAPLEDKAAPRTPPRGSWTPLLGSVLRVPLAQTSPHSPHRPHTILPKISKPPGLQLQRSLQPQEEPTEGSLSPRFFQHKVPLWGGLCINHENSH